MKPAEPKTEQQVDDAGKEGGQAADKEAAPGAKDEQPQEAAEPKAEAVDGVKGEETEAKPAEDDEPDVSTESDENRPGREAIQLAESKATEQAAAQEQGSKAEPSDRDGQAGAAVKPELQTAEPQKGQDKDTKASMV